MILSRLTTGLPWFVLAKCYCELLVVQNSYFPYFFLRRLLSTAALISGFSLCLGPATAALSSEVFDDGASSSAGGSADLPLNRRPATGGSAALSAAGTRSFPRLPRGLAAASLVGLTARAFSLKKSIHLVDHSQGPADELLLTFDSDASALSLPFFLSDLAFLTSSSDKVRNCVTSVPH